MEVAEDIVNLSDDDYVPEITHKRFTKKKLIKNCDIIETIDLEDLLTSQKSRMSNNNVIDLCDGANKSKKTIASIPSCLHGLYEENALLAEFIEKCLDLENSEGMSRIVNNTLMRIYNEMDQDYRHSRDFERVLLNATRCIETDPNHKFSHLKNLCEAMKLRKAKKRAKLTTLATNLKKNGIKRLSNEFDSIQSKKQKVNIIIDSDDEHDIPVINLEDDEIQNDIIILDESQNYEEKENQNSQCSDLNNLLEPVVEVSWDPNTETTYNLEPATSLTDRQSHKLSEDELVTVKIKELENKIGYYKKMITIYDEAEVDFESSTSPYIMSEKFKEKVVRVYEELCNLTGHSPVKHRKVSLQVLEGHPPGPVKKLEKFLNDNIGKDGDPPFPDFNDVIKCVIDANVEYSLDWTKQEVLKEASALFIYCGKAMQRRRQQREYKDLLSRVKQEDHDPADDDLELRARLEANRRIAQKNETDIIERYVMMQDATKKLSNPSTHLNGPQQTNLPDSDTHLNTESMENGNSLENQASWEVPINTATVPEVIPKVENNVDWIKHTEYQTANITNEQGIRTEPRKPLGIDTNYTETISIDKSTTASWKVPINTATVPEVIPKGESNVDWIKLTEYQTANIINEQGIRTEPRMPLGIDTNYTKTISIDKSTTIVKSDNSQFNVPIENMGTENKGSMESEVDLQANINVKETKPLDIETDANEDVQIKKELEIDKNVEPGQTGHSTELDLNKGMNISPEIKIKMEPEEIVVKKLEDLGDDYTVSVLDIEDPFVCIEISDSSDDEGCFI